MTTPDRPLRMELTFEMPGTAEQVWDAIATANGISSWFMPTDMEERVGGAVCFHMGEDSSEGTVTEFDAPHRIVYEEPDWAGLSGHKGARSHAPRQLSSSSRPKPAARASCAS